MPEDLSLRNRGQFAGSFIGKKAFVYYNNRSWFGMRVPLVVLVHFSLVVEMNRY